MFQYTFGRRLALQTDEPLKLDLTWFDNQEKYDQDWTITLFEYDIQAEVATEADVEAVLRAGSVTKWMREWAANSLPGGWNLSAVPEMFPRATARYCNYYREVRGEPDGELSFPHRRRMHKSILRIDGGAYLDGYWETPEYFEDVADVIREDLTIDGELSGKSAETARAIADDDAVSVHVRRGDLLSEGPHPLGNALPPSYYHDAAERVSTTVTNPHFFVFSDDPDWAVDNLAFDHPTTYVTHNDERTDYLDVELMRRCDHHVIANSTFSWWGAWLNDDTKKVVTYPTPWKRFGYPDDAIDDWDLVPDDWVAIPYDGDIV
jgi:hypothetical protein